jgi:PiT family inorganic phosphate transporter
MTAALLLAAVVAVSYANGANDTFKGVATLYGSGAAGYRTALVWATATTLAGSFLAAVLAQELVAAFSGKGLVPPAALQDASFTTAIAAGAAVTVFVTALVGIPISTTHSLVGALAGAGLMAAGDTLNFAALGQSFIAPLALSPLISVIIVATLYPALLRLSAYAMAKPPLLGQGAGAVALRALHFISAGAVSFARGTNDAPKIVGVALAAQAIDPQLSTLVIAAAMAAGGLIHSRRIARTMATRIVSFREGEGALANTVTSGLVVSATLAGLPVSTTHVSVGSLFGLAATKRSADWSMIGTIMLSWLLTLPAAGLAAAVAYLVVR